MAGERDHGGRWRRGAAAAATGLVILWSASWIGLFWVAECRTFPVGYLFRQPENSFGDDSGVAYVPHGIPNSEECGGHPAELTHIQAPWYAWRCGC